jgi:cephalosporin hydroxylase
MVSRHIETSLSMPLGDYYLDRIRTHMDETYAGIRMRKFPEDLLSYERVLWEQSIDTVLEIGTGHGGSALWFRDRLRTFSHYRASGTPLVISVDWDMEAARTLLPQVDPGYSETIKLIASDIRDPALVDVVTKAIAGRTKVLVVEDAAHVYDTTLAALTNFAHLVPLNGYFVVEDGHRDYPGMLPSDMPRADKGPLAATDEWLRSPQGQDFAIQRDWEKYLVTSNPRGWLQRIAVSPPERSA